jgi:hypothetical protein
MNLNENHLNNKYYLKNDDQSKIYHFNYQIKN